MRALAVLVLAALIGGCVDPSGGPGDDAPAAVADAELLAHLEALATFPELRFETDHGTIRMILYADWTPETVDHIGGLADDGFYDATIIHRVVDDFVIQGGDPTGTGEGGSGPAGLSTDTVPLEAKEGLQFGSGAVGLARWTEDTGDSQWFITEKPALHLNDPQGQPNELLGPYALFGQVFEGMDVVRQIAAVETLPNDRPVDDVVLQKAELLPPPTDVDLIGLVPDVVADFEAWYHVGALEVPRHAVTGHPATIRFTTDAPESGECRAAGDTPYIGGPGNVTVTPWRPVAGDGCTFETRATFDAAGAYDISATDVLRDDTVHTVTLEVLPWHDAYRPFTGATGNVTTGP